MLLVYPITFIPYHWVPDAAYSLAWLVVVPCPLAELLLFGIVKVPEKVFRQWYFVHGFDH
jgi:hypothetical protein